MSLHALSNLQTLHCFSACESLPLIEKKHHDMCQRELNCVPVTAGRQSDRSQVAYSKTGTQAFASFSILSALGTIAFSFGDVSPYFP